MKIKNIDIMATGIKAAAKRLSLIASFLVVIMTAMSFGASAQETTTMRIQGRVLDESSKPVAGVFITQNYIGVARTDDDGYFTALVSLSIPMKFYCQGYGEGEHMPVLGRQQIEIKLGGVEMEIDAVQITIQDKGEAMRFEDSQMEIVGDHIHLRTRFFVPQKIYSNHTRLIVQPILQDLGTMDSMFFRAMVVDGKIYDMVDDRKYGFELDKSPIEGYKSPDVAITKTNKMVSYHDSLKIKNIHGEYSARVALSIEDYNRLLYLDYINIADGTINPLRFFAKNISGVNFGYKAQQLDEMYGPSPRALGYPITDARYTPSPNLKLYNDHGSARIAFRVNAATIDYNDEQSLADLGAISGRLRQLLADPDASVQGVSIRGVASPDGVHASNISLAARRSEFILSELTPAVPEAMRSFVKLDHSSEVASWLEVAQVLEEFDSNYAEQAEAIREIVKAVPTDFDEQFARVRRIPIYYDVIAKEILPTLRRVEYEIKYSIFRILSAEEIRGVYETDYTALSRHDYHILLNHTQRMDLAYYKQIVDCALELYPNYAYALNEKTRINMSERIYDASLLEPYVNLRADQALLFNQMIMLLKTNNFAEANRIAKWLSKEDPRFTGILNYATLNTPDIADVYPYYEQKGGMNDILVLLALKRNAEAYSKINAMTMPSDSDESRAIYLYVKALCANRMENLGDAIASLQAAVDLHRPLADIMAVDADLIDLVELIVVPE
ncbi:MAG: carboxypeptidase-like regulatory domain-containing protein [Rikenellaceae bacterium]